MPQTRVNLTETADKKVRLYMAKHDLRSKEKAIIQILEKLKA